ncbi:MAG: carboxypeptidase regulatory-like domain-containing protein [candidate division Zixibacteria bacterium]|nr:carboxypeptidase regulatory-like domain-containing protein [candidate division Zixibacteria bacterium]
MKRVLLILALILISTLNVFGQELPADVLIWYGNLDGSPIVVGINDTVLVDVWIQCDEDIDIAHIDLSLGTNDQYINSLISETEGQTYPPVPECNAFYIYPPYGSPPNDSDWSSQMMSWTSHNIECQTTHFSEPIRLLSFAMTTTNDSDFFGQVVFCLANSAVETYAWGYGDHGQLTYEEYYSPFYFYTPDPQSGVITGNILDSRSEPIQDVYINISDPEVYDTTDVNGKYLFDNLAPGVYSIALSHSFYPDTLIANIPVSSGDTTYLNLTLGGIVTGTVTTYIEGLPIEEVLVCDLNSGLYDTTDSNGCYSLENLVWGINEISFYHPYYEYKIFHNIEVTSGDTTYRNATLREGAYATGTVTNTRNDTLSGVYIYIGNLGDTTDINGRYFIGNIRPHVLLSICASYDDPDYYPQCFGELRFYPGDTLEYDIAMLRYSINDVGATEIFSPPTGMECDSTYPIISVVENYGTVPQTFDIAAEVRFAHAAEPFLADTIYDFYLSGLTAEIITFAPTLEVTSDTTFVIESYTILETDEIPDNDIEAKHSSCPPEATIWYGNPDGSPVFTYPGDTLDIDVYIQSPYIIYTIDAKLGASTDCFNSFILEECVYYPIIDWKANFFRLSDSPPNPQDWIANWHFALSDNVFGDQPLYAETPTKILTYALQVTDDISLAGDTLDCLSFGIDEYRSGSWVETDGPDRNLIEYFSPVFFIPPTDYTPGDANGDDNVIGSDVTYLVNYFRSAGGPPPDSCWNYFTEDWHYCAADANGDCLLIGSDVTFMVNYFRSEQPSVLWCEQTPPLEE